MPLFKPAAPTGLPPYFNRPPYLPSWAYPTGIQLQQTDTSTGGDGGSAQCSGASNPVAGVFRIASVGGTPGSSSITALVIPGNLKTPGIVWGIAFESPAGSPGITVWDAGQYYLPLEVTAGSADLTWVGLFVCRVNSSNANQGTVGSLTGQNISLATAGIKGMVVNGNGQSANTSDKIYFVLTFTNSSVAPATFTFKSSQIIYTPLQAAAVASTVPSRQPDQRMYFLPLIDSSWYQIRPPLSAQSALIAQVPPATKQPDQRQDPLPWFDWTPYMDVLVPLSAQSALIAQIAPTTKAPSQRHDPLPFFNYVPYELVIPPPPLSGAQPAQNPPSTKQPDQRSYVPPDYNLQWWEFPPPLSSQSTLIAQIAPATKQPSQRFDPLFTFDDVWWRPHPVWPIPVEFFPPVGSPVFNYSQRFDPLPFFDWTPYMEAIPPLSAQSSLIAQIAPATRKADQRFDALPFFDYIPYELVIPPPPLSGAQPAQNPPATKQPDQRSYILPDFNLQWWEWPPPLSAQSRLIAQIPPPTKAPDQRSYTLPNYDDRVWRVHATWPIPVEFITATPPPTKQPSQRWDALPKWDYSWFEHWPSLSTQSRLIAQVKPTTHQPSQRFDSLPVLDYVWWKEAHPLTSQSGIIAQTAPATKAPSQRHDPLPYIENRWWIFTMTLGGRYAEFAQIAPPTKAPSQRFDPLFDYNLQYWEALRWSEGPLRIWPFPEEIISPPPPIDDPASHQLDQRWDPLPVYYDTWYRQYTYPSTQGDLIAQDRPPTKAPDQRMAPLFTYDFDAFVPWASFVPWIRLAPRVTIPSYFGANLQQDGNSRVANDIEGYVSWVGTDVDPDLTTDPDSYSAALPVSIPVIPPVVGTTTFHVVTRFRDTYGLVSQNQKSTLITIDTAGNQVFPAVSDPQNLNVFALVHRRIKVIAAYPLLDQDEFPADQWYFWIGTTPPNTGVDTPTRIHAVRGNTVSQIFDDSYLSNTTYYVAVKLFRTADGTYSNELTDSITFPALPTEPGSVHSGYVVE